MEDTNTSGADAIPTDATATTAAVALPGGETAVTEQPAKTKRAKTPAPRADAVVASMDAPAAATALAKRFKVSFKGNEVEQTDSPIVAHARVQEGFDVLDGAEDYAAKLGVTPREPKSV